VGLNLLITGGSGLMGSNMARLVASQFSVYAAYCSHPVQIPGVRTMYLNIKDRQGTLFAINKIKPELIIHAAALANVDYCEQHPPEAWAINVEGTYNVALAANSVEAKLIYISTDSVFDGERGMYAETDTPHPINTYAKTKLEGEARVQNLAPDSLIIRTSFYGWSVRDERSLAEQIVRDLRAGKSRQGFADIFFSPVYIDNLVEVLIEMYHINMAGIYNVAGSGRCSKYHFGKEIAAEFGLDGSLMQPGSITEADLIAPRPRDLSLDVSKVSREITTPLQGVREGIKRFKEAEAGAKSSR